MREVTVITGGAGGMGFAAANVFGRQGQTIVLCDIKEESLKASAAILERQNMDVHYRVLDVADEVQVKEAAAKAAELGRIKNVVNTAGLSRFLWRIWERRRGRERSWKSMPWGRSIWLRLFIPCWKQEPPWYFLLPLSYIQCRLRRSRYSRFLQA